VLISRDGGRSWHTVPTVDHSSVVESGGGAIQAAMFTSSLGFAIARTQAWFTRDGGRSWFPVTIH
jgi:hypothetical protein